MFVYRMLFLTVILFAAFAACAAYARDFSAYPCNVFDHRLCFRFYPGSFVKVSSPADYLTYEISDKSDMILTIYVGDSVDLKIGAYRDVHKYETKAGNIWISFIRPVSELNRFDAVLFKPDGHPFAHIFSEIEDRNIPGLKNLVSSIRPCVPIKSGGQNCLVDDSWSVLMVNVLEEARGHDPRQR